MDDARLAARLGGCVEGAGVIRIEHRLPLRTRHGTMTLECLTESIADLPDGAGMDPGDLVFLDTETTGLAGGTGTLAFLLGLARRERDSLCVRQYLLSAFAGEAPMLDGAAAWMAGAAGLVTFNGKCFDVPLLAARCRLAGTDDAFSSLPHLDLLHPTRRAYGSRWMDCRLATAEQRLLGFSREDDLPGSEAPQAWFDYIRGGDAARLPAVARHNFSDLLSLAALLPALAQVYARPAQAGADLHAIARACRTRGLQSRAARLLRDHVDHLDDAGLLELARLHRRRREWDDACAIWSRLAGKGCAESRESLAKFYEHVRGDYHAALTHAASLPESPAVSNRKRRLRARLAATAVRSGDGGDC
jgi:uncharacterized protein YprB with RNaseH-like and TPR domain